MRDVMARGVKNIGKKLLSPFTFHLSPLTDSKEEFWALKDVSFEVKRGETLGIIGRNGAGKTTLLKLLSRITEPTTGRITIKGRVASLLEVGTGFHPELTGRENIFLNGAILGMSKAEIKKKFDEIVAFAEVEKFLDTPVKRYSSGMYVRLAFAVAAHLEPEILVVDEVLAVGDAAFQKKCLGKMGDVAREGRTVLFVSHNMGAMSSLCTRAIVLTDGDVSFTGTPDSAISKYITMATDMDATAKVIKVYQQNFETKSEYRITGLEIIGRDGLPLEYICTGGYVCFRLAYELDKPIYNLGFRLMILSDIRVELFRVVTNPVSGYHIPPQKAGKGYIDCVLPSFPFTSGTYFVDVAVVRIMRAVLHSVENAARIEVQGGDVYGSGFHLTNKAGFFISEHEWKLKPLQST